MESMMNGRTSTAALTIAAMAAVALVGGVQATTTASQPQPSSQTHTQPRSQAIIATPTQVTTTPQTPAPTASQTPAPAAAPVARDASHDFDFEIGEWSTHVKRLQRPLSGSTTWVEYTGTTMVRGVLGRRANLAELSIEGPAGRIEGAALRLYNPGTHQWSVNYFNAADGTLTAPLFGEFRDGRGVFSGPDTFAGRAVLVRFVILKERDDRYRFEQSFSADGGEHWELNWVATDTRRGTP
jgi:hypothetical protein